MMGPLFTEREQRFLITVFGGLMLIGALAVLAGAGWAVCTLVRAAIRGLQ